MNGWIEVLGMPVYSKKNSKQITSNHRIISSKRVRGYEKNMIPVYLSKLSEWKKQYDNAEKPVKAEIYFIRPTRAKFDYINICQLPFDMMQTAGWIEDVVYFHIIPVFIGYEVNKDKTRCGLKIRIKTD